jgi:signal transduction histidine kinase
MEIIMAKTLSKPEEQLFVRNDRFSVANTGHWLPEKRVDEGLGEILKHSDFDPKPSVICFEDRQVSLSGDSSACKEENQDLMAVASKDIRDPLVSMVEDLKLLKEGTYGKMDRAVSNEVDRLFSRIEEVMGFLDNYSGTSFSVKEGIDGRYKKIHLMDDVLGPVLNELSSEIQEGFSVFHNALESTHHSELIIQGSQFHLKAIFRNLLRNILKYGGRHQKVAIGFKNLGTYVRFNIYNGGKPIPEEWRNRLFTKSGPFSLNPESKSHGMGLGLYLVKKMIQAMGGEIWFEGKRFGSNFVFIHPTC